MHKTDLEYRILRGRMHIMPKGKCEKCLDKMGESFRNVCIPFSDQAFASFKI